MESEKNTLDEFAFHKVSTNIPGLDAILYDGLNLSYRSAVILIVGGDTLNRTTLSMQLLYGIGQSYFSWKNQRCLTEADDKYVPYYVSTCQDKSYLDNLLLDMIISNSIQKLTTKFTTSPEGPYLSNTFSEIFFNIDHSICSVNNSVYDTLPSDIDDIVDKLLGEGAVFYSNRTDSLHFKLQSMVADSSNAIYRRRFNSISEYFKKDIKCLKSDDENDADENDQHRTSYGDFIDLSRYMGFNYIKASTEKIDDLDEIVKAVAGRRLVCVDIPDVEIYPYNRINKVFKSIKERKVEKSNYCHEDPELTVTIISIPDIKIADCCMTFPMYLADMIINLRQVDVHGYMESQIAITDNRLQHFATGWHHYKLKDYGIEIYPNLKRELKKRRYLQNSLIQTHSDKITDTFQQYLDNYDPCEDSVVSYDDFIASRRDRKLGYLEALRSGVQMDYRSGDLLGQILLVNKENKTNIRNMSRRSDDATASIRSIHEDVTAIIGHGNTYKRFLVFGGAFSNAMDEQHTLIVLLSKDERAAKRRLVCPAISKKKGCSNQSCEKCYSYIHFMSIKTGYISPEEFLFYIKQQLDTPFRDGKSIKKIIIDDLEILKYCYPLLRSEDLFIPALVSLCQQRDISLHLLCDKDAEALDVVHVLADNIICTDRDNDGHFIFYIQRFAGYNNSPSKIYGGKIESIKDLFECYTARDREGCTRQYFGVDSSKIKDHPITSMANYWISNDTRVISNSITKKK